MGRGPTPPAHFAKKSWEYFCSLLRSPKMIPQKQTLSNDFFFNIFNFHPSRALRSSPRSLLCTSVIKSKRYLVDDVRFLLQHVNYGTLSQNVKNAESLTIFKTKLKTFNLGNFSIDFYGFQGYLFAIEHSLHDFSRPSLFSWGASHCRQETHFTSFERFELQMCRNVSRNRNTQ